MNDFTPNEFVCPLQGCFRLTRLYPRWYVFPIRTGRKEPIIDGGHNAASNKHSRVEAWSKEHRGCNWAVSLAKSGLIVVDLDRKPNSKTGKPGVGLASWSALELLHGDAPPTLRVLTPTGGLHYYFNATERVPHVFKLRFQPDCDSPHYVLLPGSVVEGVGKYRILGDTHTIADAPDWLGEYLKRRDAEAVAQIPAVELDQPGHILWAIDYLKARPPGIEGQGGERALLLIAGILKDYGISQHKSVELIAEHYAPRCEPPWKLGDGAPEDRIEVKVANAWAYLHDNAPGERTAEADFADDVWTEEDARSLAKQIAADKHAAGLRRVARVLAQQAKQTEIDGRIFPVRRPPPPKPKGK